MESYLLKLQDLYRRMDGAYEESQAFYGFECTGCLENCCTTYFFHYTICESLYLLKGVQGLNAPQKEMVIQRASIMCHPPSKDEYLCPVNFDGRCIIYPFRTMICRLHGIPYILRMPDGREEEGPGCAKFEAERKQKGLPYRAIDRTPFYRDLSLLEKDVRDKLGYHGKFKRTIAEIIRDRDEIKGLTMR